jgi:phage portal protein BeeE
MRFNTNEFGNFSEKDWFCPICRKVEGAMGACPEHGIPRVPVAYWYKAGGDIDKIPFAKDEIIHFNKYSSTARLYGHSPIIGLAKKIRTALEIEAYQLKQYILGRPAKAFIDIPGLSDEALKELFEFTTTQVKVNPNYIPMVSSQGSSKSGMKVIPLMPSIDDLGMMPYLEKVDRDVNAAYGVSPLAVADLSGVGGLNAEGEQITMMDRTIRGTQQVLEQGFFKPLLELLGIDDWEITYNDIDERNEAQYLANLETKARIIAAYDQVGLSFDIDEDGELIFPSRQEMEVEVVPVEGVKPRAPATSPAAAVPELPAET